MVIVVVKKVPKIASVQQINITHQNRGVNIVLSVQTTHLAMEQMKFHVKWDTSKIPLIVSYSVAIRPHTSLD